MATAQIRVNGNVGSNDDVPLGDTVYLSNLDDWGVTTWEWTLVSQPNYAPYTNIQNPDSGTPFLVLNKEGSYLIRLVVNKGLEDEATDQIVVAVRELETYHRIPAVGETTELSGTAGWTWRAINDILHSVTRLQTHGMIPAVAGEPMEIGDIVYVGGIVGQGEPHLRKVAKCYKALASNAQHMKGVLGFVVRRVVDGSSSIDENDRIQVCVTGLFPNQLLVMAAGGSVGDRVYVSDTGHPSLSAGTHSRQIGTVAVVSGSHHYTVYVSGYPSDPSSVSGDAGGVLGYTGSTYPNPTGLSGVDVGGESVIPLVPAAGQSDVIFRPDVADQSTNVVWEAGNSNVDSVGGDLLLVGGKRLAIESCEASKIKIKGSSPTQSGDIEILAGNNTTSTGNILISSNEPKTPLEGSSGEIFIASGSGGFESGNVYLGTGWGLNESGPIIIETGNTAGTGVMGTSGTISILGGVSNLKGGDIHIEAGVAFGTGIMENPGNPGNLTLLPGYRGNTPPYSVASEWGRLKIGNNLYPVIPLSAGSLLHATTSLGPSTGAIAELYIGMEGQVLSVSEGMPVWTDSLSVLTPGFDGQFLVTQGMTPQWANPTAGGILAYPGSTYPNPIGLSGVDLGDSVIPLVPATGYNDILIRPDSADTSTSIELRAGDSDGLNSGGTLRLFGGRKIISPEYLPTGIEIRGSNAIGASGGLIATTGNADNSETGDITIRSGEGKITGAIDVVTGYGFSTDGMLGASGRILLRTGDGSTSSGEIGIFTGNSTTEGGTAGGIGIKTGYGQYKSGDILIQAAPLSGSMVPDSIPGNITVIPGYNGVTWGELKLGQNFYPPQAFTTGSILYVASTTALGGNVAELPVGSEGNVLVISSGLPAWTEASTISTLPTGTAGGVLGYPGSTYPNPNGLSAIDTGSGNSIIPLAAVPGVSNITFRPDDSGELEATDVRILGGLNTREPGIGPTLISVGGAFSHPVNSYGGGVLIETGGGTDQNSGVIQIHSGDGKDSGEITIRTGTGASANPAVLGESGYLYLETGQAGDQSGGIRLQTGGSFKDGSQTGMIQLLGGDGGSDTSQAGHIEIRAGSAPNLPGNITLWAGNTTDSAGVPGSLSIRSGFNFVSSTFGTLEIGNNNYPTEPLSAGSLLHASALNVVSGLPVGNDGDFLSVVSGLPSWGPMTALYGCFTSSVVQPIGATLTTVTFNSAVAAEGLSIVSGSQVTVPQSGVYVVNISPRLIYTGAGNETVIFWLLVNGFSVPESAKSLGLNSTHNHACPTFELTLPLTSGQTLEWVCVGSTGTDIYMQPETAVVGPPLDIPAIPSIVFNIRRIGA